MYFFSTKAFLILAIVTAKIVYLSFLTNCISGVAPIMWIFIVLNKLWSSTVSYIGFSLVSGLVLNLFKSFIVFYIVSYLGLDLVLNKKLVLDLGLGSSSIFFIVKY